jgi:hypothetical protein
VVTAAEVGGDRLGVERHAAGGDGHAVTRLLQE